MEPNSRHRLAKWIVVRRESLWTQVLLVLRLSVMGFSLASLAQQLCTLQVNTLDAEGTPLAKGNISVRLEGRRLSSATFTLTFSMSGFDPTNHFNPLDVPANLSDPLYGVFFENYAQVPGRF